MGLLIKNGTIITASEIYKADIYIKSEKITQIGLNIKPTKYDEIIDATDLEIYPGAIDVHTHLDLPYKNSSTADDFKSGTMAAACGGTTTIIDFITPRKNQSLYEAFKIWQNKANNKSAIDYSFHATIVEFNEKIKNELIKLSKNGITSVKCYMAYKDVLMINDYEIIQLLEVAKKHNILVLVHAENGDLIYYLTKKLLSDGKVQPKYHMVAHPKEAEAEAVNRIINFAKIIDVPIYIVHNSCMESIFEIQKGLKNNQIIFAETCPQYLILNNSLYNLKGFEPAKWVISPPLRSKDDNEYLWNAINEGLVKVVATDHCSFNFKNQKEEGINNFALIPNGMAGIGDRVNLIYSFGVSKNKINKNKFCEVISTNPAKIFGLYPKKGTILVGSDADLTIIDPNKKGMISIKNCHYKTDYHPYEGLKLNGMCVMTILRGKIIFKDNKFLGDFKYGKFIKRKKLNLKML